MEVLKIGKQAISQAVKFLEEGGVVVFPTDTVYGFLADAENKKAVEKIFEIKKRPSSKPLPVFVKDIETAKSLAGVDKNQENILKKYWFTRRSLGEGGLGKYTFILNKKNGEGTIALRIPKYKPLNDLLKKINKPLAQTSVNVSGQPALTKISDIIKQFEQHDILVIDGGDLQKGEPSQIFDITGETLTKLR